MFTTAVPTVSKLNRTGGVGALGALKIIKNTTKSWNHSKPYFPCMKHWHDSQLIIFFVLKLLNLIVQFWKCATLSRNTALRSRFSTNLRYGKSVQPVDFPQISARETTCMISSAVAFFLIMPLHLIWKERIYYTLSVPRF